MSRLVVAHPLEHAAHRGVFGELARLGRLEGGERLAHAPFDDGRRQRRREVEALERAADRQGPRPARTRPERLGEAEAEPRMLDFVAHRHLRLDDQIGRGAEREQLQGEAREGGDRRVLHQAGLRPVVGHRAPLGLVEPAPPEGPDLGRPIAPLGQGRQPPHALDDKGTPRLQGRPLARHRADTIGRTLARLTPFSRGRRAQTETMPKALGAAPLARCDDARTACARPHDRRERFTKEPPRCP